MAEDDSTGAEAPLSRAEVARRAVALRRRGGWDPSRPVARASATERLAGASTRARLDAVEGEAGACRACAQLRVELADDTALCDRHFDEVMGT